MTTWKIGQRVNCDRPGKQLADCFVRSVDSDSVVIFCPSMNTVICGRRSNLEKLGWRVEEQIQNSALETNLDFKNLAS